MTQTWSELAVLIGGWLLLSSSLWTGGYYLIAAVARWVGL